MRYFTTLATAALLSMNMGLSAFAHQHDHGYHKETFKSHLAQHLGTYRDDTHALMTVKIDLQTWKSLFDEVVKDAKGSAKVTVTTSEEGETPEVKETKVEDGDDLMAMFDSFNKELKEETGIDLFWDVLLNLGTHMTAGYRAFPNRAGDLLFQLDVKSGPKAKSVMNKLFNTLEADGETTGFVRESFGPQTLYTFVMDEDEPVYQRLSVAVQDDTVIATIGPDSHQLKTMLYLGQVHPVESEFRLTSVPYFNHVKAPLKEHPFWMYTDLNALVELAEVMKNEIDLPQSDIDLLAELIPLSRGLGFGMNYKNKQMVFEGVAAHDMARLTPFQKAYLKKLKSPSPDKNRMKKRLLGPSPFVFVGEKLDLALEQPFPMDPARLATSENFAVLNEMSYTKLLPQFTGLSLDKDLLPYLDGNYGFSVVELPNQQVPQSVMVLGLQKGTGPAFETVLKNKFRFDMGELMSDDEAKPIKFEAAGEYKGATLYRMGGLSGMDDLKGMLNPMAAQKDDVWILGQTEAAVKAALDNNRFEQPGLKAQMVKTDTRQAANTFFMDITRLIGWATTYGLIGEDEEEAQMVAKAFRSIYSATYHTPETMEGKLVLDIDFSQLPFEEIFGELGEEFAEGFSEGFSGAMESPAVEMEIEVDEPAAETATESDS